MTQEKLTLAQRYEMAQGELQQLSSIITRIDERLEIFMQKHDKLDVKLADHIEFCPAKKQIMDLFQRISTLEATGNVGHDNLEKDLEGVGGEVEAIYDDIEKIKNKQKELELLFQEIKINSKSHEGRWKWVGQFVFQAVTSLLWIIIAIVLYHFGIGAPPTKP